MMQMEKLEPLQITDEMQNSRICRLLQNAETVCFVGDSLTEGTINGGVPWYEPIRSSIRGKIVNVSQGGATTKILLAYFLPAIVRAEADLVVVAAGANDILFRDPMFCAMTAADYIQSLQKLRDAVCERRPDAKFVFIAPWIATDGDAGIQIRRMRIIRRRFKRGAGIRGTYSSTPTDILPVRLRRLRRKNI